MPDTPVQYPTITIGGRELTLKFSMLAKFQMSKLGVGASDFRLLRPGGTPDPGVVAVLMRMFSCAVADNFIDADDPFAPVKIPSPEYWAATIGDDAALWSRVCEATFKAMVKATPPGSQAPIQAAAAVEGPLPLN